MKAHLAKLSLALLSTVFLLGCQDLGSEPVGPEGLGPEFKNVKNCDPDLGEVHPSCKPAEDGDPRFTVTMGGDISSVEHGGVANNRSILMNSGHKVDFTSLLGQLTCGDPNSPIMGVQTASQNPVFVQISGGDGRDGFFQFSFTHNDIKHTLVLAGTIAEPLKWATLDNTMTQRPGGDGDGRWSVTTGGRNHQDGCTGEGGGSLPGAGAGVTWTATFVLDP